MGFRYTFQKIVDLKTNEKTQAEWMLSTAIGRLQEEKKTLSELQASRNKLAEELMQQSERSTPVFMLRELQNYAVHLDQCIVRKSNDVHRANINVQKKQDVLTHKLLDEKVWLKSREKAKAQFQQEVLLQEQNELDEMATVRYAMRSRA